MSRSQAAGFADDDDFDVIVADFGRAVTRKLRTGQGSPEDHLRGPFERMLAMIAGSLGLPITTIGETRLPDLSLRPDYAVNVAGARVGYVELKKPGHGVPETWPNPSQHDKDQWQKFQLLPNVLYSDGERFARYEFGKLCGRVARLEPGLDRAGERLHAVGTDFARVLTDFLLWEPEKPRSLAELVRLVARLCRLLRDDVTAELAREKSRPAGSRTFTDLAADWRQALFPNLTDEQFADQYAQTITFALLLARVEGVEFRGRSISEIARLLGKKHSLMGRALTVLTDQPDEEHSVALTTMTRVLSVVDWADFPDDSYALLYQDFLAAYDPKLRRKSGTYYTPDRLVAFVTRFVDDVLRSRLGRSRGFADQDVIVVDPAMGTGSFLAEVVNTVAATVAAEEGEGAVAPNLRELSNRLIGFENQAAPYAVAELRIHGLLRKRHGADVPDRERRFLADALDDPNAQTLPMGRMYEAIERSRRGANKVKRDVPVMVVIGNPPYVDKVKGIAAWIESPNTTASTPSLTAFRKPGNGRLEYVLANTYVYFWRWATWKVFDAHPAHPAGVVAMVCSAGFTTGPGFAGMREYLRRTADEGWIIDLTPEGHQPPMATRFFRTTQQPICVAVFVRGGRPDPAVPAPIHRIAINGSVEEKADKLDSLAFDDPGFRTCTDGMSTTFQVMPDSAWNAMPSTVDLMPWASPGVKPNRTWVYAPEEETLRRRWERLVSAPVDEKAALLKETRSTRLNSVLSHIEGMYVHRGPIAAETSACPTPERIGYRSFDRMWIIPDVRLNETPRPALWIVKSSRQVFVVEQHAHPIRQGSGLVFSSLIPDMDHFMGHAGGRVFPLYRDSDATVANVAPGLLEYLAVRLGRRPSPLDLAAYLAAVTAHPGFTRRFADELKAPGIRIPLTGDAGLWDEAVRLGQEVLWLHTYGERCVDPAEGRPAGPPKMRSGRPYVRVGIPDTEQGMPERVEYDEATRTLRVGIGEITPVAPEVWAYQVSGMRVVKHWLDYRKKKPAGNRKTPLDQIVATRWTPAMTTELLALLNVVGGCVEREPRQEALLDRIVGRPLITVDELTEAGVVPVPPAARIPPSREEGGLFAAE